MKVKPILLTFSAVSLLVFTGFAAESFGQPTPEQKFFEWTSMPFEVEVYQRRRARILEELAAEGGGVLLVPSRTGRSDGFTFRQLDDFIYFTGLELPDSMLAIDLEAKRSVLFLPDRDPRYANASRRNDFPGRLLGEDPELHQRSGIEEHRPISELTAAVARWVEAERPIRLNFGAPGAIPPLETGFTRSWSAEASLILHLRTTHPDVELRNAFEGFARVRMVHGPEEIEAMRRVCDLTLEAIRTSAGAIRNGVTERELEAELERTFKRGGSQRLAFSSIIKSGPNSLWPWRILAANYDRRNRATRDGELVIFDVGTELDYYVSDVGRTFPVSGKFTADQRRILEMEVAVADAVLAAIRPGVTFGDLKRVAVEAIPEKERPYMQAGGFFGHHIGLSTGDPALADAPLEPGMIFTVEPWYYNHAKGIAVFTEDVVLVTEEGVEVLTDALPRTPDELERMVGEGANDRD